MKMKLECLVPSRCMARCRHVLVSLLLFLPMTGGVHVEAAGETNQPGTLAELSLEELMNVEVTSAARKSQSLANTSAAVYVLSSVEIRRSGATTIPAALRLVPGLSVAQIDSGKWAVSSRGFNDMFANKMLVLIDGRSTYSPLFAGTFWDAQDIMLEDVARIEVVRGPGATMWGVNAVNGVVNIITRSALESQGGYAEAIAGTSERGLGGFRYGGRAGSGGIYYRVQAKYMDRQSVDFSPGGPTDGGWSSVVGGIRVDWSDAEGDDIVLEGGWRNGEERESVFSIDPGQAGTSVATGRQVYSGGHALVRWRRTRRQDRELMVQAYYDRGERTAETLFQETRETFAIELQQRLQIGRSHDLMWGLTHRQSRDEIATTPLLTPQPGERTLRWSGGFMQDEITLIPSTLTLTLGTKLDWNSYTGVEVQPTIRMLARLAPNQTLWGAVSRAVRTPSRAEHDINVIIGAENGPGGSLLVSVLQPAGSLVSEWLTAYELGYRWSPRPNLSINLAAFENHYTDLTVVRPVEPASTSNDSFSPIVVVPQTFTNDAGGSTRGFEVTSALRVTPRWSLSLWYAWLRMNITWPNGAMGVGPNEASPSHQFHVRSSLDLPRGLRFDTTAQFVDKLEFYAVDHYLRLDAGLAWRVTPHLELSFRGDNLLQDRHREIGPNVFWNAGDVRRSCYGRLSWWF